MQGAPSMSLSMQPSSLGANAPAQVQVGNDGPELYELHACNHCPSNSDRVCHLNARCPLHEPVHAAIPPRGKCNCTGTGNDGPAELYQLHAIIVNLFLTMYVTSMQGVPSMGLENAETEDMNVIGVTSTTSAAPARTADLSKRDWP